MNFKFILIIFSFSALLTSKNFAQIWNPNLNDNEYQNPIIWTDYSDPDIVRVGKDFYMTASSFNCVPALPILHSTDLVNWEIVNYAVKKFTDPYFNKVQHGNGVWAPSIRFHDGWFYIYWGDPDRGIFMVKTKDPLGIWSEPILVKKAYGNIDPCPLWDDDGKVYLVHAFANSRAGLSHILQVQELSADGTEITDNRNIVINGYPENHTLEGPKFYKRNGYYYIFAPAGGVEFGWQMVFRSKYIWGPYEGKRVLEQGSTKINGPHQGGWIELENGENWFVHFQELQPFGRIVHLEPVRWEDDWPKMGIDYDGNGIGEPVAKYEKPNLPYSNIAFNKSDEFNNDKYNLEWQWQANYKDNWFSLNENKGNLRLYSQYFSNPSSIFTLPNILAQKIPGPEFTAITKVNFANLKNDEKAGLTIFGLDYATITIRKDLSKYILQYSICKNAREKKSEVLIEEHQIENPKFYLRVNMDKNGICKFSYSSDAKNFNNIEKSFKAREGRWIGAKIGIFAISNKETGEKGFADFDWFRFE